MRQNIIRPHCALYAAHLNVLVNRNVFIICDIFTVD